MNHHTIMGNSPSAGAQNTRARTARTTLKVALKTRWRTALAAGLLVLPAVAMAQTAAQNPVQSPAAPTSVTPSTPIRAVPLPATAVGAPAPSGIDFPLAPGDTIRIQVFQNPDLTLETRVSDSGNVSYPLVGTLRLGGLSVTEAERAVGSALSQGGFIQKPQVTIVVLDLRGSQVAVLGQVNRPGRFVLETATTRVSDVLALAGGAATGGDDVAIVTGQRNGQAFRQQVDIPSLFLEAQSAANVVLQGGDTVYVHRAPVVYIYGEAQRPGAFRIERGMTVMQALAQGGGPTARGSERRLRLHRTASDGSVQQSVPALTDTVQANDVIFVRESLF